MTLYDFAITLHLLAMSLWLGHMFVWSLIVGPAMKRIEPPEAAERLRERSVFIGGFGWPALTILALTGLYLLSMRGIAPVDLMTSDAYAGAEGTALAVKLVLVLVMLGYQAIFAHGRASIAIYANMAAALVILACSVVLVRGWV